MGSNIRQKLAILADAAKYDASCASSGGAKRDSRGAKGVGSVNGSGICHSYTPDGRCVSLLKILLTNYCMYDCAFCVNRVSSNVRRARFTAEEAAQLTIDFYRRNFIEGLFLSSGIIRSPDYTMEHLIETARLLRETHQFRGYIHLKAIADADPALIARAGELADRLSVNIELPQEASFKTLAPEKQFSTIRKSMASIRGQIDNHAAEKSARKRRFATGQSTQMIVGADSTDDSTILRTSAMLYGGYRLRRVYYSAFSPIPDASAALPPRAPPLRREHRLYQADWLLRNYGFSIDELTQATDGGMLDLDLDPKTSWALKNRALFPVDVNRAPREMLLRVPGLGVRAADRMIAARRHAALRLDDISRLASSVKKLLPFITALDWTPGATLDSERLMQKLRPEPRQLDLFACA
ncbi:putative DNA modification/repair radical SAM protein [Rhodoblastus sphagnicola]|uniref:Putative DNA modification/repair radical SAM protein n=1 Tax=Rhodoblastus sphagnicola TaxID=333368 RepID=A0A2S6NC93_9HYPH|nr:putative DNA modification/repair radical SAM protein [Rhodoblastus sphagnicola]MBB4196794.1 putative DNA modification/repair radical SAM protein [Rhodoblastus sphagnicola]PPQ32240.1 putative DNA modification/repair radical SAM protein [Rhodoblastus sphagnicola]